MTADPQGLKPTLVAQVEFVEWTQRDHLRHARFLGLRNDKDALDVTSEDAGARRDSASPADPCARTMPPRPRRATTRRPPVLPK